MSQFVITPYLQQTETQARQILPQSVSSTFPLCSMQVPLSPFQPIISFCKSKSCSVKNDLDSVVVGIVRNVYNWLYHGIVGTLFAGRGKAALCFSMCCERRFHDGIGSYAHFHNAKVFSLSFSFTFLYLPASLPRQSRNSQRLHRA